MNLFEHQQQEMRLRRANPAPNFPPPSFTLMGVMNYIEKASLKDCWSIAVHLSARLFKLEEQFAGIRAANINEAAHFVADAALDIDAVSRMEPTKHCTCGKCDSCVAARSDEHYDRSRP